MKNYSWLFFLVPLPYIYLLITKFSCGWDCPWYLTNLKWVSYSEIVGSVEPLYFLAFKPLTHLFNEVIVLKLSLAAMLILAICGMHLLSKRLGFNRKESVFVAAFFGLSVGTIDIWYHLPRNMLMLALSPYFFYFYLGKGTRNYSIAAAILYLMALAHRTVVLVFMMMGLYRIISKDKKGLLKDVLLGFPILAIYLLINPHQGYGGSSNLILDQIHFFWVQGIFSGLWDGIVIIGGTAGFGIITALMGVKFIKMRNRDHLFMAVSLLTLLAITLFFGNMFAGRTAYMTMLPLAVMTGLLLKNLPERGRFLKGIFTLSMVGVIASVPFYLSMLPVYTSDEERDFIESIDIPEGSLLVVPGRLYYTAQYVWYDKYRIRNLPLNLYDGTIDIAKVPELEDVYYVYQGVNMFGEDLYYVEANHGYADGSKLKLSFLPAPAS